LCFLITYVY